MALKAIYAEEVRLPGGGTRMRWGLGPQDFHKVRLGYACPECLEDFNGVYMAVCPVCGHTRNVHADFEATPEHFMPGKAAPAPEPW